MAIAQVQAVKDTAAKVDVRIARELAGRAVSSARSAVDGCAVRLCKGLHNPHPLGFLGLHTQETSEPAALPLHTCSAHLTPQLLPNTCTVTEKASMM